MMSVERDGKSAHLHPSDLRGLARLAAHATAGLADLVEAMHHAIARPLGMADARTPGRTRGITGLVYTSVRGVTRLAVNNAVQSVPADCLWYHADYVAPSWGRRLTRVEKIGAHIFYRS